MSKFAQDEQWSAGKSAGGRKQLLM